METPKDYAELPALVDQEPPPEYRKLTRRTGAPKLEWLLCRWLMAGLRVVRYGQSWHAPITWVHPDDDDKADAILRPIDDAPDHDRRFHNPPEGWAEWLRVAREAQHEQSLEYFNRYIAGDR